MKYVDFKKFTDENGAQSVYLLEGEEAYFREKGEGMLKEKYVQEPTLDYISFEGSALKGEKIKTLTDAVNCFPFISQKRMVRVTEFYPTDKEYEQYLQEMFENPPIDSILLIVNSGKGKKDSAALVKKPNVTYVDCGRADEETIKKWIYVTCKRAGVFADGITCGKIAEYCLFDMARISKETEKLLVYCEALSVTRLTDEIVDEIVYPDSEYKIFELANAVSRKNYSEYMRISSELLSKGFDEIALLSSLANYFKNLFEASVMRGGDKEVATALGLKEYAVKKSRETAQKFEKGAVLRYYECVYSCVSRIKCGELTPQGALSQVTASIFFA